MTEVEKLDLKNIRIGLNFAKEQLDEHNFNGAVEVQHVVLDRIISFLEGDHMEDNSSPDIIAPNGED